MNHDDDKPSRDERPRTILSPGWYPPNPPSPGANTQDLNPRGWLADPNPALIALPTFSAEPPLPSARPAPPSGLPSPGHSPGQQPRRIQIGDVLNHLYEVRRFIARGGMGEVFEGVNIYQDDERVAIKVILPHLAADPNVLAMFRKEAHTLTKVSHPALVQYRTLAQEPSLQVVYIVTEYIDGASLASMLRRLDVDARQIRDLIRHLAEGLRVAHAAGAIHRDMAPDNIMLVGGRLEAAKIIDFGIAKSLDPGSSTIVGDGFAGKLNYVAPEQLGVFGGRIGPWTDIYSLGLSILALIERRDVEMGGTIADAINKRRSLPDLSRVPGELRPVLQRMLQPDPAARFQSMDAVIAALDTSSGLRSDRPVSALGSPTTVSGSFNAAWHHARQRVRQRPWAYGGGAAALLLGLTTMVWLVGGDDVTLKPETATAAAEQPPLPADPLKTAQTAIAAGMSQLPCSWLEATDVSTSGRDVAAAFSGVSGQPGEAQGQITHLLEAQGLSAASLDFGHVAQIGEGFCGLLDTLMPLRDSGVPRLHVAQPSFEVDILKSGGGTNPENVGKIGTFAVINAALPTSSQEAALLGITVDGEVFAIATDRASMEENFAPALPNGDYRLEIETTHVGWSGIILLTGQGPFDPAILRSPAGRLSPEWRQRFLSVARAKGWKAEIAWYQTVDALPNT